MSKREQVERDAEKAMLRWGRIEMLTDVVAALRASGFTICGPDEVPMPKEIKANGVHALWKQQCCVDLYFSEWDRMVDAYQRARNADTAAKGGMR